MKVVHHSSEQFRSWQVEVEEMENSSAGVKIRALKWHCLRIINNILLLIL